MKGERIVNATELKIFYRYFRLVTELRLKTAFQTPAQNLLAANSIQKGRNKQLIEIVNSCNRTVN